jgi:hypothetical protein
MMGVISSALFNPATIATLENLNQEGAASLLVRDGLQNVGIVNETKKQNKDLADEMNMVMWVTWATWGGGAFAMKQGYFEALKKMFPYLAMAKNGESDIKQAEAHGIQHFTPEVAKAYATGLTQRVAGASKGIQQQAAELATDYLKMSEKNAEAFLKHSNIAKLGGVLLAGVVPAYLTGFVLPKLAQQYSKNKLSKRALHQQHEQEETRMLGRPLEPTASSSRLILPHVHNNTPQDASPEQLAKQWQNAMRSQQDDTALRPATQLSGPLPLKPMGASPSKSPNAAQVMQVASPRGTMPQALQARAGGISANPSGATPRSAEWLWKTVNYMNQNTNITNLAVVDSTVSGGRVISAEDASDRIRWATYEGIFVYMMYFGSPQVRNMIQQSVINLPGFKSAAHLQGMSFESLANLQREANTNPEAKQALKTKMDASIKQLGIAPEELARLKQSFETYILHSHLLNDEKAKEAKAAMEEHASPIVNKIRQHMVESPTLHKQGDNLVLDMLMSQGIMPTHKEGFFSALKHGRIFNPQVLGLDISQTMNTVDGAGEKGVANILYRLEQMGSHSVGDMKKMIQSSYTSHALGIGASLAAGFLVMGHLSPLLQSWLSNKVTGQALPGRLDMANYTNPEECLPQPRDAKKAKQEIRLNA